MAAIRTLRLALSLGLIGPLSSAGPWAPIAAASSPYLLPLPSGTHVVVTQGNGGGHTGWEEFAWDFAEFGNPEFPVVAARGGTVIGLQAGYKTSQHCEDDSCWTLANYVLIDQGDKTSALYMHLAENSVEVSLGQKVTLAGLTLGDRLMVQTRFCKLGTDVSAPLLAARVTARPAKVAPTTTDTTTTTT